MAEDGRPNFDLSSFLTFTFPSSRGDGSAMLGQDPDSSQMRQDASVPNFMAARTSEDEVLVDLTKFGPPDALANMQKSVPPMIITVIKTSINTVQTQVEVEQTLRHSLEVARDNGRADENDEEGLAEDARCQRIVKGKHVEVHRALRASASSDQTDSPLFYTPADGPTPSLPSADTPSDAETEALTAVPTATHPDLNPTRKLRLRESTTSASARRRDLVKSMFRKLNDGDTRRQALRRSAGALQLKSKLNSAKNLWRRTPETRECISCFDDLTPRELVQLPCHNYCKPCFGRLIAHSIETESNWPPKCCLSPISTKKCLKHISGDLEKLYKQKRKEYSTPIEQRYYCPITDCGVFVSVDENAKDLTYRQQRCSRGHLTCVDCHDWAHTDAIQCPKNKDMFAVVQTMAHEEGWRRCYRCNTMIEHQSACRHITCRCGAEFCYVCGKRWWTCGCTERQLDRIKKRAHGNMAKRKAWEERERREAQELRQALEAIAKLEAEAAVKQEKIRVAKEARRKRQVHRTYAEYTTIVDELNDFQRSCLDVEHQRDQDHLTLRILEAVDGLRRKHEDTLNVLKASSEVKIEERTKQLEQAWLDRNAQDLESGGGRQVQTVQWKPVRWDETIGSGQLRPKNTLKPQKSGYEQGRAEHLKRRNDTIERLRYVLEEEIAIQQELMDAKKARIVESFGAQAYELRVKIRSQLRWLELVVAERSRLLAKNLGVELADEILDEDDERWTSLLVKEETVKASPSRFGAYSRFESAKRYLQGQVPSVDSTGSETGSSSQRLEDITREPSPPPWNPQSLGSALHAAWDTTWDAYWNPRSEGEASGSMPVPPQYSRHADPAPSIPPKSSARAPESSDAPSQYPPTPPITPSEERPPTPAPWTSLLQTIGEFLLDIPARDIGREPQR